MSAFFMYDAGGDWFEVFDTEAEALAAAEAAAQEYREDSTIDGEWSDDVERIVVGRITHHVRLEGGEDTGFEAVLKVQP